MLKDARLQDFSSIGGVVIDIGLARGTGAALFVVRSGMGDAESGAGECI